MLQNKNSLYFCSEALEIFLKDINEIRNKKTWTKEELIKSFVKVIPDFKHKERGKYLDEKM